MTADELNRSWTDQLAPPHRQVWDRLRAEGIEAAWMDDFAPRFVVSQQGEVLATHLKGERPAGVVVPAALFEAGHKLEAEQPGLKILPPMASL
ncbi:hypothetical protein GCM10022631_39950 [Deinococcus rubellus]|uniref:Uncharacterized protein n=1 Tax=Deinococcus rubellus TaxID=1889240 RepID=A0ABY5YK36_9DEIO|nr:hypothetical protein [Deinococcus rubellus]UWX65480.1 hypothetical protein N0D28_07470 [Deinococcus rubellus]